MDLKDYLELINDLPSLVGFGAPWWPNMGHLSTSRGWSSNQPSMRLDYRLLVLPTQNPTLPPPSHPHTYLQGFDCVELNLATEWGGHTYEGNILEGVRVSAQILDRRGCWDRGQRILHIGQYDPREVSVCWGNGPILATWDKFRAALIAAIRALAEPQPPCKWHPAEVTS